MLSFRVNFPYNNRFFQKNSLLFANYSNPFLLKMEKSSAGVSKAAMTRLQEELEFKKRQLENSIALVTLKMNENMEETSSSLSRSLEEKEQKKGEVLTESEIMNEVLPLSDGLIKSIEKLVNTLPEKQKVVDVCTEMAQKCALSSSEALSAKKQFDQICDYSSRRKEAKEAKELYTPQMLKYLINKTFKKTATEIFFMMSTAIPPSFFSSKETLRVASIGGGPGSDIFGCVAYLKLVTSGKTRHVEADVYDYNWDKWRDVSSGLLHESLVNKKILTKEETLRLNGKELIQWHPIDFTRTDFGAINQCKDYDIITVTWALNESHFSEEFWGKIADQNQGATYFIVEGESPPLERLSIVLEKKIKGTPVILKEFFQNPRRLLVYPEK